MTVRVAGASEAAALDAAAIQSGTPSRTLMRTAAVNAATVIASRFPIALGRGVVVFTGSGNNGGDGWGVAGALHRAGANVVVREVSESRSVDARAERSLALSLATGAIRVPGIVVDAVLGTGAHGPPDAAATAAIETMRALRADGAALVALDVPTGLDASSGDAPTAVAADMTIAFGSLKRGCLVSRSACGEIVVVDIGVAGDESSAPTLVDAAFVRANVPGIDATANKGTRKHVAIAAGGEGMGGAAIIASIAALRSGAGLVKIFTAPANFAAAHERVPQAIVSSLREASEDPSWPDAMLVGPGLGTSDDVRPLVENILSSFLGPVALDADGLNVFAGDLAALASLVAGKKVVLTPHPAEMARLMRSSVADVLDRRWDIGAVLARDTGCTVLLKGTPTIISSPDGSRLVVARGTAALATGGSGDALGGTIATLLAQGCTPDAAGACAAWIHGRAAELLDGVRGTTLDDVLGALRGAWNPASFPKSTYPVLTELPAVA